MTDASPTRQTADLADLLELLLEKGVVVNADIVVSIGDTELLGVKVRAAIASFETAAQYGLEFPEGTDMDRVERAAGVDEFGEAAGEQARLGEVGDLHQLGPGGPGEQSDEGDLDEAVEDAVDDAAEAVTGDGDADESNDGDADDSGDVGAEASEESSEEAPTADAGGSEGGDDDQD